jgi:hypothetical protein
LAAHVTQETERPAAYEYSTIAIEKEMEFRVLEHLHDSSIGDIYATAAPQALLIIVAPHPRSGIYPAQGGELFTPATREFRVRVWTSVQATGC